MAPQDSELVSANEMQPFAKPLEAQIEYRGHHRGVNHPIEASVTFQVPNAQALQDIFSGQKTAEQGWYVYGRSFSPTVSRLGQLLADMEGTAAGYACSSGMAAICSVLLALCSTGDHIVASDVMYGGSYHLLAEFLPAKAGITTTFVPIDDLAAVQAAITPRTKVLLTEAVSNPTLVVADLPRLASLAHSMGAQLVVDNTFTPLIISPAKLGADVVVHSLTKFISGGADVIGGCVCGSKDLINQMLSPHGGAMMMLGPTMDPKTAHDLSMRLAHLPLRIAEHSRRTVAMAGMLQNLGAKVIYPGLSSHPHHELMKKLANLEYGFGGLMALDMGSPEKAAQMMDELQNVQEFGLIAVSLGYFDTLMSISATSTGSTLPAGSIPASLVRMSIGITGALDERMKQLEAAFVAVKAGSALPACPLQKAEEPQKAEENVAGLPLLPSVNVEEIVPVLANGLAMRCRLVDMCGTAMAPAAQVAYSVEGSTA